MKMLFDKKTTSAITKIDNKYYFGFYQENQFIKFQEITNIKDIKKIEKRLQK